MRTRLPLLVASLALPSALLLNLSACNQGQPPPDTHSTAQAAPRRAGVTPPARAISEHYLQTATITADNDTYTATFRIEQGSLRRATPEVITSGSTVYGDHCDIGAKDAIAPLRVTMTNTSTVAVGLAAHWGVFRPEDGLSQVVIETPILLQMRDSLGITCSTGEAATSMTLSSSPNLIAPRESIGAVGYVIVKGYYRGSPRRAAIRKAKLVLRWITPVDYPGQTLLAVGGSGSAVKVKKPLRVTEWGVTLNPAS